MYRILRNELEGLLFLVVFPGWLLLAVVSALVGMAGGWRRERGALGIGLKRWTGLIARGLRSYREAWWPLPEYESGWMFWRHLLLAEFFAALNQAGHRPHHPERIAVIKLGHVGDAMHIAPMLRQLMKERPEAEIDLVVGPWCEDLAKRWNVTGRVWTYVSPLMMFNRGRKNGVESFLGEIAYLMTIRRRGYAWIISTGTTTPAEWLLIQALRPANWIGPGNAITRMYGEVASHEVDYDSVKYEAERVSELLRPLGVMPEKGRPGYPLREEENAWAETEWGMGDGKRVVMAPGAGWPGKMWPVERFGALAAYLVNDLGAKVVVSGSPDERALGEKIAADCPQVKNLIGATTVGQSVALVASADLLIGNDSAPLHFAAAYDTASIALFGPTVASKWSPRGEKHRVIQKSGYCQGCVAWHPAARCMHDNACMRAIEVEDVMSAVQRIM